MQYEFIPNLTYDVLSVWVNLKLLYENHLI